MKTRKKQLGKIKREEKIEKLNKKEKFRHKINKWMEGRTEQE